MVIVSIYMDRYAAIAKMISDGQLGLSTHKHPLCAVDRPRRDELFGKEAQSCSFIRFL